ncbi:type III-B CRISPR module RAMP protein Cmr6 [Sulfobacillus thermotolerans]|uniref:Type III-B CRISPR module RAMP protein Cmr6 n=1 Tax=Sulfobacillus thermotolerans TaxID=338644 RepID=A0ABM6RSE9_9FIRM|nr:type III-B CRISPR module RAMP protein Cmr6 [Sulfobacillus thermotolerans]
MRPLYQVPSTHVAQYKPSGNLGLWHEKFYDEWKQDSSGIKHDALSKVKWIHEIVQKKDESANTRQLAKEWHERLISLVNSAQGTFWIFESTAPFVTGLGQGHPIENGFAWHPLLGMPYIPGSSLKGMLKAWPTWSGDAAEELEQALQHVIIFDALPILPVRLQGEVMTPHYGPYYQGNKVPGDYHNPIPIPFLAVAPGQKFVIAAIGGAEQLKVIEGYLEQSLEIMGIGAKTSNGFGRFKRHKALETDWRQAQELKRMEAQKAQRLAALAPWEREMVEDGYDTDPEIFMNAITTKWLDRLDEPTLSAEERSQVAERLERWYLAYRADQWKKPNKKNAAKIARIKQHLTKGS